MDPSASTGCIGKAEDTTAALVKLPLMSRQVGGIASERLWRVMTVPTRFLFCRQLENWEHGGADRAVRQQQ